jgi:hypothetical protein
MQFRSGETKCVSDGHFKTSFFNFYPFLYSLSASQSDCIHSEALPAENAKQRAFSAVAQVAVQGNWTTENILLIPFHFFKFSITRCRRRAFLKCRWQRLTFTLLHARDSKIVR